MIMDFRLSGYMAYSGEAEFSLRADPRIDTLGWNVHREGDMDGILKSACVYGANNSGKTCLVKAVGSMLDVLMNRADDDRSLEERINMFSDDKTCGLGVSFLEDGKAYSYEFRYSANPERAERGFVYERMDELCEDGHGKEREIPIFLRDVVGGDYFFDGDERLSLGMRDCSTDEILIYAVSEERYPAIRKCRDILRKFAGGVEIVDMNSVSPRRTLNLMRTDGTAEGRVEAFVKCADIGIRNFVYLGPGVGGNGTGEDAALSDLRRGMNGVPSDDPVRLISYHEQNGKTVPVPSVSIDSVGTGRIVSLAGYILDAMGEGKTVIVDELDAGLHFRLTRAIVLLFDDRKNDRAQLIFTTHDVALLDCERLFRKDQIWFVDKDDDGGNLYSMVDVDGVERRSNEEVFDRYKYGDFGAIPLPDLTPVLSDGSEDDDRG